MCVRVSVHECACVCVCVSVGVWESERVSASVS